MNDAHTQGNPPHGPNEHSGHEGTELNLRPIFGFGIGLIVMAVVIHFVLGLFMKQFEVASKRAKELRPVLYDDERGQYPGPVNQVHPRLDLQTHRANEKKLIGEYGWSDEKSDRALVPIDRALDILAEKGLPKVKNIPPHGAKTEKPK